MNATKQPVAFFAFNRPSHTCRVLDSLRSYRPDKIYVACDGPRAGYPADSNNCKKVLSTIREKIDWSCEIIWDVSPVNLGCEKRISSGLEVAFSRFESMIVLEDDCVPDPSFFTFCEEMLSRYSSNDTICSVGGACVEGAVGESDASYRFSKYFMCWGWAGWKRTWAHYDSSMKLWKQRVMRTKIDRLTYNSNERRFWRYQLEETYSGRLDSWDTKLSFGFLTSDRLSVIPRTNLISNIGFGPEATHTKELTSVAGRPLRPISFPLVHPKSIEIDNTSDKVLAKLLYQRSSLTSRIVRKLYRTFRSSKLNAQNT